MAFWLPVGGRAAACVPGSAAVSAVCEQAPLCFGGLAVRR